MFSLTLNKDWRETELWFCISQTCYWLVLSCLSSPYTNRNIKLKFVTTCQRSRFGILEPTQRPKQKTLPTASLQRPWAKWMAKLLLFKNLLQKVTPHRMLKKCYNHLLFNFVSYQGVIRHVFLFLLLERLNTSLLLRCTAHDINIHILILLCKERQISVFTKMLEY